MSETWTRRGKKAISDSVAGRRGLGRQDALEAHNSKKRRNAVEKNWAAFIVLRGHSLGETGMALQAIADIGFRSSSIRLA